MKLILVAFAVFLALSHVEAPALANHRQSIRVAYPSLGLPQAPLWIASAANYFNEVGLRVESLFIQNSSTVIQSMLSDEIDYAMVGPAPVVAVDLRGADIVMIATTIPTLIFYVIARHGFCRALAAGKIRLGCEQGRGHDSNRGRERDGVGGQHGQGSRRHHYGRGDVGRKETRPQRTFRLQRPGNPICPCRLCRQALFPQEP
jgi:NMT1/THI5 like